MKRLITTVAACACAFGLFADVIYVAPDGAGSGTSWADGFGAARSADAFSYGPVVNRLPGLAVMLK